MKCVWIHLENRDEVGYEIAGDQDIRFRTVSNRSKLEDPITPFWCNGRLEEAAGDVHASKCKKPRDERRIPAMLASVMRPANLLRVLPDRFDFMIYGGRKRRAK